MQALRSAASAPATASLRTRIVHAAARTVSSAAPAPTRIIPRAAVSIVAATRATAGAAVEFALVRRATPPDAGVWSLPGGKIEAGEPAFVAATRELREETGLAEVLWHPAPFTASDAIHQRVKTDISSVRDAEARMPRRGEKAEMELAFHYLIAQYAAFIPDKSAVQLLAGDDASEAEWFSLEAIEHLDSIDRISTGIAGVCRTFLALEGAGVLDRAAAGDILDALCDPQQSSAVPVVPSGVAAKTQRQWRTRKYAALPRRAGPGRPPVIVPPPPQARKV